MIRDGLQSEFTKVSLQSEFTKVFVPLMHTNTGKDKENNTFYQS